MIEAFRKALSTFGHKLARCGHPGAIMTGMETRTAGSVRITRGSVMQSLNVRGLYRPARARPMPGGFCPPRSTG